MPKHPSQTRAARARDLLNRAKRGPHWSFTHVPVDLTNAQRDTLEAWAQSQYEIWAHSWLLRDLCSLVPELRDRLTTTGNLKEDASK